MRPRQVLPLLAACFLSALPPFPQLAYGDTLALADQQALMAELAANWTLTQEAIPALDQKVDLRVQLSPQATLLSVAVVDQARYETDAAFRALADSAILALRKAASDGLNLPADGYQDWREIIITFDISSYPH